MKTSTTHRRRDGDKPRGFWGKAWYLFTAIMTFFVAMDGEGAEHSRSSDDKPKRPRKPARR